MGSSNQVSLSLLDREISITNYDSALEFGRLGLGLRDPHYYQKTSKTPTIYYKCPRPGPVLLNQVLPETDRALLPLV